MDSLNERNTDAAPYGKRCARCGETKPFDQFYSRGKRPGHNSYCKPCSHIKRAEWGKANQDKENAWNRAYEKTVTPEKRAERKLRKDYKMTLADYEAMLASQGGGCAVCGSPPPSDRRLHVDHDHSCCDKKYTCGKCVRGLLCLNCNAALGHVRDNKETLVKLIDYLAGTPGQCKADFIR